MSVDFFAIGDTVVDEFIRLKEAQVHCRIDTEACEICMRWGDKIPFESSTLLAGVGNSANAAVAAARLGLSAALLATIGDDEDGTRVVDALSKEKLDTSHLTREEGKTTNHHFVLWYESERTILVKAETYARLFPSDMPPPRALYLSSLGDAGSQYYADIAAYVNAHPDIFFTFQPGTFQMKLGIDALKAIYARANLFVVNKEEAERILDIPEGAHDIRALAGALQAHGPKIVIITEGREGAYALANDTFLRIPMYPDSRAPFERTGAGDAFAASITAALSQGLPLEEALLWGPVNSMNVVQEIGAQKGLLTREQLETYLKEAPPEYRITSV